MKLVKRIFIAFLIMLIFFLAFYKHEKVSIEGNYIATKITLNDKQVCPTVKDAFFETPTEVLINEWSNSLHIIQGNLKANYTITKNKNGYNQIELTSKEKSLNGIFNLSIDTLHLGPLGYDIHIEIKSDKTFMHLKREVRLKPWKPKFPRPGQV